MLKQLKDLLREMSGGMLEEMSGDRGAGSALQAAGTLGGKKSRAGILRRMAASVLAAIVIVCAVTGCGGSSGCWCC